MWYAIISTDVPNSLEKRRVTRQAHIARIMTLKEEGRLMVAGPHPAVDADDPGDAGFTGSLIIAKFDSLTAARAWADDDPYLAAGVYDKVVVKPYLAAILP